MTKRKGFLLIILAAASLSHCEKLNRIFLPSIHYTSFGKNFLEAPEVAIADTKAMEHSSFTQNRDQPTLPRVHQLHDESEYYEEHKLGFGPLNSATKFMSNGEIPTGSFGQQPTDDFNAIFMKPVDTRPERHHGLFERNTLTNDVAKEGNVNSVNRYRYNFEPDNGIASEKMEAAGSKFPYAADGRLFDVKYTARSSGFVSKQPKDHVPIQPQSALEIPRITEKSPRDEADNIFGDGSYRTHDHRHLHQGPSYNYLEKPTNRKYNQKSAAVNSDFDNSGSEQNVDINPNAADDTIITDVANAFVLSGLKGLVSSDAGDVKSEGQSGTNDAFKVIQYIAPVPIDGKNAKLDQYKMDSNSNTNLNIRKPIGFNINPYGY